MNNLENKMKNYLNKMFYKCRNYKFYKTNLMKDEIYLEFDTNHIILETEAHVPSAFFKYINFPDGSKKCYYFPNITPDKVWQEYEIDCN